MTRLTKFVAEFKGPLVKLRSYQAAARGRHSLRQEVVILSVDLPGYFEDDKVRQELNIPDDPS